MIRVNSEHGYIKLLHIKFDSNDLSTRGNSMAGSVVYGFWVVVRNLHGKGVHFPTEERKTYSQPFGYTQGEF